MSLLLMFFFWCVPNAYCFTFGIFYAKPDEHNEQNEVLHANMFQLNWSGSIPDNKLIS